MKLVEVFMNDKSAELIRLKLNILLGSLNRKEMLEAIIDGEDLNKKISILIKSEVADAGRLNLKKIIAKENSIFHKDNNKKNLKKIAHFGKSGFIILCILLTLLLGGGDISASTVEGSVRKLVSPHPQERKLSVRELQEDQRGTIQYLKSLNKKDTSEMVSILIQAVLDNHSETKVIAISTLGNMGPKAQEALPTMLKLIKSNSSSDRWNAAWALGMISEGDEAEVIEALTSLLHDRIPKVVSNAALALGTMGSKAKPALPSLKSKLDDRNVEYVIRASIDTIQTNNPRFKEILKKELLREDPVPSIKAGRGTFNPDEPPTMCMCSSEVV